MKRIVAVLMLLFSSAWTFAQTATVKGKVIHADTKQPYAEVILSLPKLKVTTSTDASGEFEIVNVPYGNWELRLTADGIEDEFIMILVNNAVTNLETIELKSADPGSSNYTLDNSGGNVEDATSNDNNTASASGQNVASVLNAARDPYLNAATFGWGQYFYRIRGYENDNNLLYMNGVPMNDLEEGGVFYNSWSGLNDVFRGRSVQLGLNPNEYNFGGVGLNTSLDASASNQRKGTRLTYTATNRSYRNRVMLTHSSGLKKNGWAYSVSFSRRWAQKGVIPGSFYDAFAYYGSIEKRFKKHGFSLMLVGSPVRRGKQAPATKEAFELAGTNLYNPNWGYQNGEIRNSRVFSSHAPMAILTHDARLSEKTLLTTAVSYQFGETSTTSFDWYNAADPRPDYYKYMPTYIDSPGATKEAIDWYNAHPEDNYLQVQWNRLYEANYMNKKSGNGRAIYMLGSDVEQSRKINAAVNLESVLSDHVVLHTGISFQNQKNHNFRRVEDLLGADYWENINQFAEDGILGNAVSVMLNMDDASTKRVEGDTYGYNYNIHFNKANWFGQGVFSYNTFDFFLSAELGYTGFYREGIYRHGLFPTNSKGNSSTMTFFNYRTKGGITYKLNGRNYLYANGSIGTRAPYVDNIFIAPRTRNTTIENAQNEKVSSAEVGYLLRSPNVKGRLTFFVTEVKGAVDIKRYFNDNSSVGFSFTNNVLQNLNKRYTGLEFGTEVKLSPSFTLNLAAAWTQAYYTSRATSRLYDDNEEAITQGTVSPKTDTVYIKNYYVPAGPQTALQAALNYRSKRYWFMSLTFNYLANNWIDIAPARRTIDGVDLLKYKSEEWSAAVDQQKLPSFYTVDLFGGKSFKVNKYIKQAGINMFLNLNIGISNVLNNKNIKLYGFENLRLGGSSSQPDWFVPKYAHALGIQYFINASLRF